MISVRCKQCRTRRVSRKVGDKPQFHELENVVPVRSFEAKGELNEESNYLIIY